jgi:hypothetical protein
MPITLVSGVVTEGEFHDKDEFERTGVMRDDVFAVRSSKSAVSQLKFDLSELDPETSVTIEVSSSGALVLPNSTVSSLRAESIGSDDVGLNISTDSQDTDVPGPTGPIDIITGSKLDFAGDTGDITLQTGVPVEGTRGVINLNAGAIMVNGEDLEDLLAALDARITALE